MEVCWETGKGGFHWHILNMNVIDYLIRDGYIDKHICLKNFFEVRDNTRFLMRRTLVKYCKLEEIENGIVRQPSHKLSQRSAASIEEKWLDPNMDLVSTLFQCISTLRIMFHIDRTKRYRKNNIIIYFKLLYTFITILVLFALNVVLRETLFLIL